MAEQKKLTTTNLFSGDSWIGTEITDWKGQSYKRDTSHYFTNTLATKCVENGAIKEVRHLDNPLWNSIEESIEESLWKATAAKDVKYSEGSPKDVQAIINITFYPRKIERLKSLSFTVESASPLDAFCASPEVRDMRAKGIVFPSK